MSGKHTVKIDVGAGGTEKRPLIHPRARTHTHSLFLLFSPPCCIDVPRISLSLSLGGTLVLVKTSVMPVPVSIYLRKDSLLRLRPRERIHEERKETGERLLGRRNHTTLGSESMIERRIERDGVRV